MRSDKGVEDVEDEVLKGASGRRRECMFWVAGVSSVDTSVRAFALVLAYRRCSSVELIHCL